MTDTPTVNFMSGWSFDPNFDWNSLLFPSPGVLAPPVAAVPDSDGDGQSDLFETWAGSLPGAGASFIRFFPEAATNGAFTVTFDAHAGRRYRLHRSTNLVEWVELAPDITPALDGPQTWSEPSVAPRHYYRLEARPTP